MAAEGNWPSSTRFYDDHLSGSVEVLHTVLEQKRTMTERSTSRPDERLFTRNSFSETSEMVKFFCRLFHLQLQRQRMAKSALLSLAKVKGFEKLATKPKNAAIIAIDKKYPELTKSFKNFGNVDIEELRSINPVSVLNHKYIVIVTQRNHLRLY
jgi:hypothetical protein